MGFFSNNAKGNKEDLNAKALEFEEKGDLRAALRYLGKALEIDRAMTKLCGFTKGEFIRI